ncbi:N-acetyltransferase [Catellatospora sp. IY07-71]|uniref:GNAT family N-acetyltransferase n=1 Tax=Catellatospora sp. IY07-71 TaxID=2728827 RepID=UPI001BB3AECF|nr:GNAT family protein [Catellatospora sp. IY07-71]BCJ72528.1 N-acetyltransferase [Catellatospora sp. IY07-71]
MFAHQLGDGAELRPIEPWQAEEFLTHMDRARADVDEWIPFATRSTDLDSARATLQRYADMQAADTGRILGIWLDGTLVGGCMVFRFDAEAGNCEVGVWLEPAGQGRGLITRAVRHVLDWVFQVRGMSRAEWHTSPKNERSLAVAARLGFTREGVLREAYPYRGVRHDTVVLSLLAREWPQA